MRRRGGAYQLISHGGGDVGDGREDAVESKALEWQQPVKILTAAELRPTPDRVLSFGYK